MTTTPTPTPAMDYELHTAQARAYTAGWRGTGAPASVDLMKFYEMGRDDRARKVQAEAKRTGPSATAAEGDARHE